MKRCDTVPSLPPLTLNDRCIYAAMGACFGALYGVALAALAMVISGGSWNVAHVVATAVVFAVLAFIIGPFIGDAIAGVLHVVWGFFAALAFIDLPATEAASPRARGAFATLFWFGAGTALALYLALRVW